MSSPSAEPSEFLPWRPRLLLAVVMVGGLLPAAVIGDRRIPGWRFDYLTPALALTAGLFGALAIALPRRWRPFAALLGAVAAAVCANHARIAALNVDLPCAPVCYVGEPCRPTTAECLAEMTRIAAERAADYSILVLLVAGLPVASAMATFLARPSRARLPVLLAFALACVPVVAYLLVSFETGLGGTPGPWLQGR